MKCMSKNNKACIRFSYSCPHCQGILIPYNGSIVVCAFDKKISGMSITKKVGNKILSMTMKFIIGTDKKEYPTLSSFALSAMLPSTIT